MLRAAIEACLVLLVLQAAYEGPSFTPPSTSASVVRPWSLPEPNWVTLKTAPPNVPFWFLCFFPVAVMSFNDPCKVLMIVPTGTERTCVRGTKLP